MAQKHVQFERAGTTFDVCDDARPAATQPSFLTAVFGKPWSWVSGPRDAVTITTTQKTTADRSLRPVWVRGPGGDPIKCHTWLKTYVDGPSHSAMAKTPVTAAQRGLDCEIEAWRPALDITRSVCRSPADHAGQQPQCALRSVHAVLFTSTQELS
jgi:hypothetical protein